jgi:hypothetical protein
MMKGVSNVLLVHITRICFQKMKQKKLEKLGCLNKLVKRKEPNLDNVSYT